MKETGKLSSEFSENIEAVREDINAVEAASHAEAGVAEFPTMFNLPSSVTPEAIAVLNDIQRYAYNAIEKMGRANGLTDAEMQGLYINSGHGIILDAVDTMRSDYHPAYRTMYMQVMVRKLMRDSLRATLARAVTEGTMELDKAYIDYRNYLTTDKIPYELTDELSGADKQQMPETKQVLELLDRMTGSVSDPKTRAHLQGRLDRLRERLGVSDAPTTIDTDAVNALLPDEALEEVAKQMGNGMTVERLRRAMRKAKHTKGNHGHTILVNLNDEDDGDDNTRGEQNDG